LATFAVTFPLAKIAVTWLKHRIVALVNELAGERGN
jgi:hypothetical protein